eukprot:3149016-Amphidinium_carterae.1
MLLAIICDSSATRTNALRCHSVLARAGVIGYLAVEIPALAVMNESSEAAAHDLRWVLNRKELNLLVLHGSQLFECGRYQAYDTDRNLCSLPARP